MKYTLALYDRSQEKSVFHNKATKAL